MRNKWIAVLGSLFLVAATASVAAASPATGSAPTGPQTAEIDTRDLLIIVAYLVGIVALGCWAGLRRRGAKGSDYFLASKSLSWPLIGLALFATNISTIHLVSFAQNGYTSGLTYGNFEWMAAFTLVVLSLFFAPFYLRSNVATLPDFMEKRYSRPCRDWLAVLSIFSAVVVHIGFSLLTGTIVLEGTLLHVFVDQPERYRLFTVMGLCGATALYTIIGGLLAVVLTESIQTIVLLVGSICITVIGFRMIGGWEALQANVHPVNLTIIRPAVDPTGITWYAVFLGYPVLGIWYWCTDQTIVQRVLGAKDENHARIGPLFAGFIKVLPVFLFVLPGIVCLALINTGKLPPLPTLPDGSPNTEQTYTHMIKNMLWPGMRGVVIAAMLAALMSTVSGALNSIATLFSYDIYRRWKPEADDRHLIRVGRIATFVAMCVAVVWTMALGAQNTVIFQAMVDVFPVVAPPTAVVFLWGVFWRRTSSRAAISILVGGSLVGLVIFVLTRMGMIPINSLLMAFILFVVESAAIVVLSLLMPHEHTPESEALVWKSPWEALRSEHGWRGVMDYRVWALLLVAVMVGLYVCFSSPVAYYPIRGQVTLDGKPVLGAVVYLDTEDDTLDAAVRVDLDGNYQYWSIQQAGGAPAGTHYRVRIVPDRDYLVRFQADAKPDEPLSQSAEVLAWMPAGTPVDQQPANDGRRFVIRTQPEAKTVEVSGREKVEVLRAPEIPQRYRSFATSGLSFTVGKGITEKDFQLRSSPES